MNKTKNKTLKITLGCIAIFFFGLFIGYQLNDGAISSIQGFLYNAAGWATDPNATDSNATDANASDANASDANASDANASDADADYPCASDANASDANAHNSDNIIYLQSFSIKTTSANPGSKINISYSTSGAQLKGLSITMKNQKTNTTFTASVKSLDKSPYFVLPNNISASTYIVTDLLLTGLNSNNSTFSKHYSSSGVDNYWSLKDTITVTIPETKVSPVKLNSISINPQNAKVGDIVDVTYSTDQTLKNLKLVFTSNDGKTLNVYVKSLSDKPYFEIPTNTEAGTYNLTSATLTAKNSTNTYTKDGSNDTEKFAFASVLEISKDNEPKFIYNNEDITSDIISKLHSLEDGSKITINADTNTLINEEIFKAIKGCNKDLVINYNDNQLIFNGKNITDSKTIDVSMIISEISSDSEIGQLVSEGIVLNFADNGNLPGNATLRIKANEETDKVLGNDKVQVYFYNPELNNFCVIAEDISKTEDSYYEFSLNHNSDYILVKEKLDSKLVYVPKDNNVVSFQKSNKIYLLLIGLGILVIIAVVVVIFIVKKKDKNKKEKATIAPTE